MDTGMQVKGNLAAGNWASMDTDILCSIFSRLALVDVLRVESICWGWKAAVDVFKNCSATSYFPGIPWLIFTAMKKDEGEKTGRFVNMEENKTYPFNDLAVKKMNDGSCYCIGSSLDWLVCVDKQENPYLLNPFTSHRIDLPGRVSHVGKAVLSSSPSISNNYYVAILYDLGYFLAFCKDGDSSWTKVHHNPAEFECYDDIIFHKNRFYGFYRCYLLGYKRCYRIRVWDMNQDGLLLVKNIDLMLDELITMPPIIGYNSPCFMENNYLVECQGSLLIVTRFEMSRDRYEQATSRFRVFKLDSDQKVSSGAMAMTSLSGFSLFLGRNGSISVDVRNCKMLKQNAIYFNADFRKFSGVFNLEDSTWLSGNKNEDQKSVATWVVPCMKRLN